MTIQLKTGDKIQCKSWKGDFLHRPDSNQGVTTWHTGIGNEWTIERKEDGKVMLKSWKGDYLHRPDSSQGVTTWHTGIGNEWTLEEADGGTVMFKSWKGDYLHRPDSSQGVTTWHTGVGNKWTIEAVEGYTIAEDVAVEDLSKIEGIGPKIFALLQEAGIKTYKQLAEASKEDLDAILDKAGRAYAMADPSTWMEQSALAAAGKWDELKALQDVLIGGRRK
jgi:hypothetical protein